MSWHLNSWRSKPQLQPIEYPDSRNLQQITAELSQLPPLVTSKEIIRLKQQLKQAGEGHSFVIQGGDCAESFSDCNTQSITNKVKLLLQMGLISGVGLQKPVVHIGRLAGQYAKPRSSSYETIQGKSLPSYRGDLVNGPGFDEKARTPDAGRLLRGYKYASLTMNYIRALTESPMAELADIASWQLDFIHHSQSHHYKNALQDIERALNLLAHIAPDETIRPGAREIFTSHEALNMYYESALTRQSSDGLWYNQSTHFPWIGMRTAQPDSAQVEFMRGIANPVAIKVGPRMSKKWLQELLHILNPEKEMGRLTLIHRFGKNKITEHLPELIECVQQTQVPVVWLCDPMHGNTQQSAVGHQADSVPRVKTRVFADIAHELQQAFAIHQQCQSHLAGMHLEITGENVTECIGGLSDVQAKHLHRDYRSLVDPRLNYQQSIEMSLLAAQYASSVVGGSVARGHDGSQSSQRL